MHEAVCLPCIFGCNAFSNLTVAVPASVNRDRNIRDETAHYSICPILVGIISDACHIDPLLTCMTLFMGMIKTILMVPQFVPCLITFITP